MLLFSCIKGILLFRGYNRFARAFNVGEDNFDVNSQVTWNTKLVTYISKYSHIFILLKINM